MCEGACHRESEQEQGKIARFDPTLFDKEIPHPARVSQKFLALLCFLDRRFDDLNPRDGLGQPGIHLAEAPALLTCDRVELSNISAQGKNVGNHEKDRRHEQFRA